MLYSAKEHIEEKEMKMNILLSIKPIYLQKIINGEKKYEFRKKIPNKKIDKVYLYVGVPVKKIVGFFEVDEILKKSVFDLWNETKISAGIDYKTYSNYFKDYKVGIALHIKNFNLFSEPINPYESIKDFRPPQSFSYFNLE